MVIAASWKQTLRWPKLTLPDYWKGRSTVQSLLTRLLQAFTVQSRGKRPVALPDFWNLFLETKGRVKFERQPQICGVKEPVEKGSS